MRPGGFFVVSIDRPPTQTMLRLTVRVALQLWLSSLAITGFVTKSRFPLNRSIKTIDQNDPSRFPSTKHRSISRNREANRPIAASLNENSPKEKSLPMTLSQQEQRREAQRRIERKNDVKPGTTSAIRGAKDFTIDPAATEYQWMQQASAEEQEVFRLTDRAMQSLRMLDLDDAIQAFAAAVEIKPNAYVWQDGIAKFYKGDIDGAAETFTRCAKLFESKFDLPATEERIWRNACNLKKYNTMSWSDRKQVRESGTMEQLVPAVPATPETHRLMGMERRRVLRLVHDLFEATLKRNYVEEILARARTRSLAGLVGDATFGPELDRKLWKIQAWYFLALYHDVKGEDDDSKNCLKIALNLCPNANASDIVHVLPLLHMTTRDWFDDAEINVPLAETEFSTIEEAVVHSLRTSIRKMRHIDIADALRQRSMVYTGSKEVITERLLERILPQVYDESLF